MIYCMLLYLLNVFCASRYFPSRWDPRILETEAAEEIKKIHGFINKHDSNVNINTFGDLNIVTYNLYSKTLNDPTSEEFSAIQEILDDMHPGILALQGVDADLMQTMRSIATQSKHYYIINTVQNAPDLSNGLLYYLPIVYDARLYKLEASGYFTTNHDKIKVLYGSWARFAGREIQFTVINMDLYSSFYDMTNAMFANIVSDILGDKITNTHPIIFAGTINALPKSLEELMDNEYRNLVKADKNNDEMSKNSMHVKGAYDDNVERDFIILRDQNKQFIVNYARILSNFPWVGEHYPVHAILTLVKKPELVKGGKKSKDGIDALALVDKAAEEKFIHEAVKQAAEIKNKTVKVPVPT